MDVPSLYFCPNGGEVLMSAEEVRSALTRVLAAGPVLGARLRPLLLEEFRRATARDLEPVLRSFGKFSAFLADNADLVSVQADSRSGDIRVSLKSAGQPAHAPSRPRRRFLIATMASVHEP